MQMVLPFVVQQIVDLPLQNVIDFIKSIYLERLSLHMVFNDGYQCLFGWEWAKHILV
jgi:hypothetical protein